MQQFTIEGRLPGLNEFMGHSHWTGRRNLKKEWMEKVQIYIMQARIKPIKGKAKVTIQCYEATKRRDRDNVKAGASKVILDALVKSKVIVNDSPKWLADGQIYLDYDKDNPRIEVWIEEVI